MTVIAKFYDADTGETEMDVVKIPEGFSLQLGYHSSVRVHDVAWRGGHMSIILTPEDAKELANAFHEHTQ